MIPQDNTFKQRAKKIIKVIIAFNTAEPLALQTSDGKLRSTVRNQTLVLLTNHLPHIVAY